MRPFVSFGSKEVRPAVLKKVTDIPEANFLNGITLLSSKEKTILVSDSGLGSVWHVNLATADYYISIDDPTMKPAANATSAPDTLGINGLHIRNNDLYYANSGQELFVKMPIHRNGTQAGDPSILATDRVGDDFTFDKAGNAYVTQDPQNLLYEVTTSGKVSTVLGQATSSLVEGDTSASFGRTFADSHILYITTNGGLVNPVEGPAVGGKVLAFNTLC
ncbi:hypothetical protein F5884DRAFT_788785, partial [Xylogone sp. PMI_703]